MKLTYRAFDQAGQSVMDDMEASNPTEAMATLRRRGLYVAEIGHALGAAVHDPVPGGRCRMNRSRSLRQLASFSRQLQVMLTAGTPLVEALNVAARQGKDPRWAGIITRVHNHVEEGAPLSDAMAQHPNQFDPITRSLVAAGESTGRLDDMLARIAAMSQKQAQLRRAIISALIYPTLLFTVAGSVVIMLLTVVLPRFAGIFEMLDVPLPPTTKLLMLASDALRGYWWAFILVAGAAVASVWYFLSQPAGERAVGVAMVRLPLIGPLSRSLISARIVRVLGALLEGQVPLLDAMRLTRESAGNHLYADLIAEAEDAATRGEALSNSLARSDLISPTITEAIRSSETSGQLGPLLRNLAEYMDEDNDALVRSLPSMIEPIILILLGVLVGFVAISLFMPLFDLTSLA